MHWFNSEILYGCHKHSKILTHIYVHRSMAAIPVLYQVVHSHQRCHCILIPHISVPNFPSKQCHHELDLGTLETNKTYKNKTTTAASCLVLGTIGGCQWVKSTLLLQYVMSLSVAEIITAAHKHHWKSNTVETRKGVVAHSSSLFGGPYLLRSRSFFAYCSCSAASWCSFTLEFKANLPIHASSRILSPTCGYKLQPLDRLVTNWTYSGLDRSTLLKKP